MLDNFRSQKIIWDRINEQIYEKIDAHAGDSNGRKLVVQILNGSIIEDLTTSTLSLSWTTKDKKHFGLDVFSSIDITKGLFEIYYTTEMLSNQGILDASFVLVDTESRFESKKFEINVNQTTVDDSAVQSDNSFTTLTQALIRVEDIEAKEEQRQLTFESNEITRASTFSTNVTNRKNTFNANENTRQLTFDGNEDGRISEFNTNEDTRQLTFDTEENIRTQAETIRLASEITRVGSENTRKTNETTRIANENGRKSDETTRKSNETTRGANETTRVGNENTRKTNETSRVNTEGNRVGAESSRVSAESGRVDAEDLRVIAEASREIELQGILGDIDANASNLVEHKAELSGKHITESGSNENGSYVKFDDGTLICSSMDSSNLTVNYADIGLGIWRSIATNINYSATFIEKPIVAPIFEESESTYNTWSGISIVSNISARITAYSTNTNATGKRGLIAIGRWK